MPDDDALLARRRRRDEPPGPLGIHASDPESASVVEETAPGPLGFPDLHGIGRALAARLVPRIGHILAAGLPPAPAAEAPPSPAPATVRQVKQTDWIEVALVDEFDKPLAKQIYEVTLPDAVVKSDELDGDGSVRFDPVEPGTCYVKFPELDPVLDKRR